MKSIYSLHLSIIIFLLSIAIHSAAHETELKPGDWFECEMEFENGVPVFRNHWMPEGEYKSRSIYLLSLRFTKEKAESDTLEKWSYQVLRFKQMDNWSLGNKANCSINDTWYPDYYEENIDSIRHSFRGNLLFLNEGMKHDYNYEGNSLGKRNVFPFEAENGSYYSSYSSSSRNVLAQRVKEVSDIIFGIKDLKTAKKHRFKWHWIEGVKKLTREKIQFTIHQNGSESFNKCKAHMLPNELPYAFSDHHGHKVFCITNASFHLPNTAIIEWEDLRDSTVIRKYKIPESLRIKAINPIHLLTNKPVLTKLDSNHVSTQIALKCGTELHVGGLKLFLEPGDSIKLIIRENGLSLLKNDNSKWWFNAYYKYDNIPPQAQISNEFRSYLNFKNECTKRIETIKNTPSNQEFKDALLDFYYLKSYQYQYVRDFIKEYADSKRKLSYASGSPYNTDFLYKHYNAVSTLQNFPLYFEIENIFNSTDAYQQLGENKSMFSHYSNQCGDTLLSKNIKSKIKSWESLQIGSKIPFNTLRDDNNHPYDILPKKGKYNLLRLSTWQHNTNNDFEKLSLKLPSEISAISCRIGKNLSEKMLERVNTFRENQESKIKVYGHYSESIPLENLLKSRSINILVLYNSEGTILYSSEFKGKSIPLDYVLKIEDVIEQHESKKQNTTLLYIIIFISAITIGLLSVLLINRIRLKRLKQRSAQEKLIEELKLKSVQSQLNPHFLFNALNSIQSLVNTKKYDDADKYLIGLSELLRGVLGNSDKRLVSLKEELDIVTNYCSLERLRKDFICSIDIETENDASLIEVPFMLLQPLVENAIKHGINKSADAGELKILITQNEDSLSISIKDNGPGIGDKTLEQLVKKGLGLNLTLEKLRTTFGDDAEFNISNRDSEQGTEISIRLNIE